MVTKSSSGRRRSALVWLFLSAWLAWFAAPAGTAQDLPSVDALEKRIAALEKDEAPAADEARKRLRAAVDALKAAATLASTTREVERQVESVPARLEDVKGALATPVDTTLPTVPRTTPLEQLEQRQSKTEAELEVAQAELDALAKKIEARIERNEPLVEAIAKAQKELATAEEALRQSASMSKTDPVFIERASLVRRRKAQVAALAAERALHDAERPLLPLLRDAARRTVERLGALESFWRKRVAERRESDALVAAKQAEQRRQQLADLYPALATIARRNRELAEGRTGPNGLVARLGKVKRAIDRTKRLLGETRRRFDLTRRKMAVAGLTEGMGLFLRRDFAWLDSKDGPNAADIPREEAELRDLLNQVQLDQYEIDEERSAVGGRDIARQRVLAQMPELGDAERREYEALADELTTARDQGLTETSRQLKELSELLAEHKPPLRELAELTAAYRNYIEERILWVPSARPWPDVRQVPAALGWLFDGDAWAETVRAAPTSVTRRPVRALCVLLALVALILSRRRLRRWIVESAGRVRSYRTDHYGLTLKALCATVLLAAPGVLVTWWVGTILLAADAGVARAVGTGLVRATPGFFVLLFFYELVRPKHVGEGHFRWPVRSTAKLKHELAWIIPAVVPLSVVVDAYAGYRGAPHSESVGRLLFVLQAILLSVAIFRLFRPKSELIADVLQRNPGIVQRTHRWWFSLMLGIGAMQVVLALSGYYYTAIQLRDRMRGTLGLLTALLLVNALLLRWLFIARRRLAIAQARQRAEARAAALATEDVDSESSTVLDEDTVDIPAVDAQTRQLFRFCITITALVGLFLIWSSSLPALRAFDRVQLWPTFRIVSAQEAERNGSSSARTADVERTKPDTAPADPSKAVPMPTPSALIGAAEGRSDAAANASADVVTLADVGFGLLILLLTIAASLNVPGLLEMTVLRRLSLDAGSRNAIATLCRYAIMIVGLSSAFGALGIGWDKVQWLAAALTFGLAFGLQEIFANFVSGIIILVERPVRVGDLVTVGNVEGRVSRLRMRSTTILDWDRRETLIPNKTFITSNVINWSLSDTVSRLVIPVGIAYGSDTRQAKERLLDVAAANELVLDDPKPSAIFRGFGDSTLNFELRVFMKDRDYWPALIDQLHHEIDQSFRAADIEIAFPQRDLHIRSAPGLDGLRSSDPERGEQDD